MVKGRRDMNLVCGFFDVSPSSARIRLRNKSSSLEVGYFERDALEGINSSGLTFSKRVAQIGREREMTKSRLDVCDDE